MQKRRDGYQGLIYNDAHGAFSSGMTAAYNILFPLESKIDYFIATMFSKREIQEK